MSVVVDFEYIGRYSVFMLLILPIYGDWFHVLSSLENGVLFFLRGWLCTFSWDAEFDNVLSVYGASYRIIRLSMIFAAVLALANLH